MAAAAAAQRRRQQPAGEGRGAAGGAEAAAARGHAGRGGALLLRLTLDELRGVTCGGNSRRGVTTTPETLPPLATTHKTQQASQSMPRLLYFPKYGRWNYLRVLWLP